jgi:hypothetical protein
MTENSHDASGSRGPRAIGASLVVVYNDPATKPFKAIVLYDGGFTKRAFATMTQKIQGFYQSSTSAPKSARMTNIVGDGRPFLSEKVSLGTQSWVNPFASIDGTNWDNWTAAVTLPDGVASATLTVAPNTILSDCLSWSAIVFSTTVQDTDGDGLLDVWEMDPPPLDVRDPAQLRLLPDLAQMGADPTKKDIFGEVGFLTAPDGTAYGGVVKPGHSHLPALEALTRVGQAFANAPEPIRIHFDVGGYYQSPASPYIIPPVPRWARGWASAMAGRAARRHHRLRVGRRPACDPRPVSALSGNGRMEDRIPVPERRAARDRRHPERHLQVRAVRSRARHAEGTVSEC